MLALLNAVYFKAPWQAPLSDLPQAGFRAPGGDVTVPYLGNGGSGSLKASVGDGVEEVELPYWNGVPATDQHSRAAGGPGRYAADIIMPTAESLPRFVDTLDAGTWRALLGRLSSQAVDLSFPKFSLAANRDLSQNLKALGITDAFSSQAADLSGISPIPTYVKLVRQAATLDVTKWGTVATAATAVVADATAARRSIRRAHRQAVPLRDPRHDDRRHPVHRGRDGPLGLSLAAGPSRAVLPSLPSGRRRHYPKSRLLGKISASR